MKKLSAKSALLSAAAMAACALVIPSMASAASLGTRRVRAHVRLTRLRIHQFRRGWRRIGLRGVVVHWDRQQCCESHYHLRDVQEVHCEWSRRWELHCDSSSTGLPSRQTPRTTTFIEWHGNHYDETWEDEPGFPGSCLAAGINVTHKGTWGIGIHWTGNGANQHEVILANAEGVTSDSTLGTNVVETWRGTLRDTQQTLTINP